MRSVTARTGSAGRGRGSCMGSGQCILAGNEARIRFVTASLLALEAGVAEAGVWGAEHVFK